MRKMMEEYLVASGVSAVSALSYRRDLERLYSHFENEPEKANQKELSEYFSLLGKALSPKSLTRHISVVRSFYDFLVKKKFLKENPVTGLCATQFCVEKEKSLTEEEFENLLTCPIPGFRGMRDRVMLQVLGETGLRVSELVELNRADLTPEGIVCGSGKRRRILPLSSPLLRELSAYLSVAELYPVKDEKKALFITAKGTRLTRQGFWKNLKDRAIYSGIDKPISPQTLRNTLALHLIEEGKEREEICKLLGNADVASLRDYEIRK